MRVDGEWYLCDDGIERPIVRGGVRAADGSWVPTPFLIDTGADRTVLSFEIMRSLALSPLISRERIGGIGGLVQSVAVETTLQFFETSGSEVTFNGQFAAVTDPEALDMSVLGRDIMGLFAVIVDRPGAIVCLVAQRHRYSLVAQ
jgi:predicted aspartyl protease